MQINHLNKYKNDPNRFTLRPDYERKKGTKEFQKLADEFASIVFGKEFLNSIKNNK